MSVNVIIVLGNYDANIMNKRLDRAIKEFYDRVKSGEKCFIILSGKGREVKYKNNVYETESDYMFDYCTKLSAENINCVHSQFIMCEKDSMNTSENLINCFQLIKHHFHTEKCHVILCTSTFHIKRTILLTHLLDHSLNKYSFIHTNENVSVEENNRELYNLDKFMNIYLSKL